jgi:predicted RecA/RadA family phage recombinase
MMNKNSSGNIVGVPAPRALNSGDGALVGSLFGVAVGAAASGASVQLDTKGVFTLPKNSAEAWTVGEPLYWDDTNHVVTASSNTGANPKIGVALAVAANPSSSGVIRLNGSF